MSKLLERLLFAQGGKCFFCEQRLAPGDASVEHLVATSNGGGNADENCVACCKALNSLLGRMSLKEKLRVVLNQKGNFKCPKGAGATSALNQPNANTPSHPNASERLALVIAVLRKRGSSRPRTVKTLSSTIGALFQKQLSEHEVATLLSKLQDQGIISVSDTKVSYELPSGGA